jgi:predicted transcriptional regulator
MIALNMDSPIDDVAFLARSENRIAILGHLTDEEPHSRDELMDASDVSRPTLSRILDDLETRTWIKQRGQTCRITSLGIWVHEEFTELLGTMETAQKLRDVIEWLPTDTLAFDLNCLTDSTITLPSQSDPLAPMNRASTLGRTADKSRLVTHAFPAPCLNAHRQAVASGRGRFHAVITPRVIETMAEPAHESPFVDLLASERADVSVYEGDIPRVVGINDGVVYFGIDDQKGAPLALIETDDETVLTWAEETFETYRRNAAPLTPDEFSRRQETAHDSERTGGSLEAPSIPSDSPARRHQ